MGSILVKCAVADMAIQWALWAVSSILQTEKFFDLAGWCCVSGDEAATGHCRGRGGDIYTEMYKGGPALAGVIHQVVDFISPLLMLFPSSRFLKEFDRGFLRNKSVWML